jgi:hypothetical protein
MSFTGTGSVVELPRLPGWDPRTGSSYQRRWQGTPTAVAAQAAALQAAGIKYQIEEPHGEGSYQIVTGYYNADEAQPAGEAIADNWDLDGEDLEKTLWEHPKTVAIFEAITAFNSGTPELASRDRAYLRSWCEAAARNDPDPPLGYGGSDPATEPGIITKAAFIGVTSPTNVANLKLLIRDLAAGTEAWSISRYVLRHTLTVPWGSTIRPAYTNVGKMMTTSSLIATEHPSLFLLDDLPAGYWLKRTPKVTQSGPGRWNIIQEWWHADAFSPFIYDNAT